MGRGEGRGGLGPESTGEVQWACLSEYLDAGAQVGGERNPERLWPCFRAALSLVRS